MSIVFGGVCPHPPIMVPEVGQGREQDISATREAMLQLAQRIKESGAEALVMITPHGPVFRDGIGMHISASLKGSLSRFGAPGVVFEVIVEKSLAREIKIRALDLNVPVVEVDEQASRRYDLDLSLDHGITVPLYFLRQGGVDLPVVVVAMGMLPPQRLYAFGAAVTEASRRLSLRVAVLASGDLSHRLTPDAPAGFDEKGQVFDAALVKMMQGVDVPSIIGFDQDLVNRAGECGLRPIIMMLGSLDGFAVRAEVLSYEGPFGVGYMVAALEPTGPDTARNLLDDLVAGHRLKKERQRAGESYLVQLARASLEKHLQGEKNPIPPSEVPPEFSGRRAGVFVSLKKDGQLRGCIGSIIPQQENVIQEVITSAINAGSRDPRFYPVQFEELAELAITVDVLAEPEEVAGPEELDPHRYGVIVQSGNRSGVLLPNLEGVDTVEEQLAVVRQKAGLGPEEPVQLYRFEVVRHY